MLAFMAEKIIAHSVKQWPNSAALDRKAANNKQANCVFFVGHMIKCTEQQIGEQGKIMLPKGQLLPSSGQTAQHWKE